MTDDLQKDPNSIVSRDGEFTYTLELKVVEGYPKTTAAMSEVAAAELLDDRRRKKEKILDYTASFEKLIISFDCFVHEYYDQHPSEIKMKNKSSIRIDDNILPPEAGNIEFTLRLLWLLRHICFHEARCVSKENSKKYSELMGRGKMAGRHSVVKLPESLECGKSIALNFDRYKEAKECLFDFIKKKGLSKKDISLLRTRSCVTNIKLESNFRIGVYSQGINYWMNYKDLKMAGIELDLESDILRLPNNFILPNRKEVVFLKSGIIIPIFIEKANKYEKTRTTLRIVEKRE